MVNYKISKTKNGKRKRRKKYKYKKPVNRLKIEKGEYDEKNWDKPVYVEKGKLSCKWLFSGIKCQRKYMSEEANRQSPWWTDINIDREYFPRYLKKKKYKVAKYFKYTFLIGNKTYQEQGSWHPIELGIFHVCLRSFGCGNWDITNQFLQNKNTAQVNVAAQKFFGQQSTASFSGSVIDPYKVWTEKNSIPCFRKSGVRVHEGAARSTECKKADAIYWRGHQEFLDFPIPHVEKRRLCWSKKFYQMLHMTKMIYFERLNRKHKTPHEENFKIANFSRNSLFNRWLDDYFSWSPFKIYNLDNELVTHKDQANLWPKTRLVEDSIWFYADQFDTWNFLTGKDWLIKERKIERIILKNMLSCGKINLEEYNEFKFGFFAKGRKKQHLDEIAYPEWSWILEKDRLIHECEIRHIFRQYGWYKNLLRKY